MKNPRLTTTMGIACVVTIVTACGILRPQQVQARPFYAKVFQAVYPDRADAKCAICHFGADKKHQTDYGKAVEEALRGKNVKDEEAIKAALKEAEGKLPPKKL